MFILVEYLILFARLLSFSLYQVLNCTEAKWT